MTVIQRSEAQKNQPMKQCSGECGKAGKGRWLPDTAEFFYKRQKKCKDCYRAGQRAKYHTDHPEANTYKNLPLPAVQKPPEISNRQIESLIRQPKPVTSQEIDYVVNVPDLYYTEYRVRARSAEQAIQKLQDGEGKRLRNVFVKSSEPSEWTAEPEGTVVIVEGA